MAYADHTGWGHVWRRRMDGNVVCQCGLALPLTSTRGMSKDQKGQLTCALAMDLLAQHGMIVSTPDHVRQGLFDHMKGSTFDG